MRHKDNESKAQDSIEELKAANEHRIDALLSINNRYVRTQRHLEQHSDITDLKRLKHVFEVQEDREGRMENLKNIISNGVHEEVDPVKNLKKHLEYTDHYLQHNDHHMDEFTLQKTDEKQHNRKNQLDLLS